MEIDVEKLREKLKAAQADLLADRPGNALARVSVALSMLPKPAALDWRDVPWAMARESMKVEKDKAILARNYERAIAMVPTVTRTAEPEVPKPEPEPPVHRMSTTERQDAVVLIDDWLKDNPKYGACAWPSLRTGLLTKLGPSSYETEARASRKLLESLKDWALDEAMTAQPSESLKMANRIDAHLREHGA